MEDGQRKVRLALQIRGEDSSKSAIRKQMGNQVFMKLSKLFRECKFDRRRMQHCYRCSRPCIVCPPKDSSSRCMVVAGVECIDYSTFGSRQEWVGDSMVVLICWIAQMISDRPELILLECVLGFKVAALEALLVHYHLLWVEFCPTNLGIPTVRERKYMLLSHKATTQVNVPLSEVEAKDFFSSLFYRTLIAEGSVYVAAEQDEIQQELVDEALQRRPPLPAHVDRANLTFSDVLAAADRRRLASWIQFCEERQIRSGFLNFAQGILYMSGAVTPWAPTLLQTSRLYDVASARVRRQHLV